MKAYDVTGVGLNLGTADEFARKVSRKTSNAISEDARHVVLSAALGQCCASFGVQHLKHQNQIDDVQRPDIRYQVRHEIPGINYKEL